MITLLLCQLQYGGYISLVKFAVFLAVFFAWIPIIVWVHRDSEEVRTNTVLWTGVVFAIPAAATVLCLLIPFFVIGILLQLIAVTATAIVYVMHRNSMVSDFEKVLTVEHIKGLLSNDKKQAEKAIKGIVFITANKNQVDSPDYKTPEFFGFQLAQEIIDDAIWRRASEITMLPAGEEYNVFYKIDGIQTKQEPRDREDAEYLIRFLKHLADLDTNERRKPQIGNFTARKETGKFKFQLTTSGSTVGEKVSMLRVEEDSLIKIDELGLTKQQLEKFMELRDSDGGIFIVSGPEESGITATFYSLIRNHDPFLNNINTLEKKETAELPNVTQNFYKLSDTGTTTYAKRLQTMTRTGPDIIGVADCDDPETAQMIADFISNDRKITYITIHAPSVIQALVKWFKMVPDKNLAIDVLSGISCQRLVRKLCAECREAYEPNKEVFKKFNLPADKIKMLYRQSQPEYDKHGNPILCDECQGTGFIGRTGIFETIFIDEQLKQAKSLQEIANHFRRAKMLYLQEQAIRKVVSGNTSIDEVIRKFAAKKSPAKKRSTDK